MYLHPIKLKNCVLITACSAVLTPALIAQTPLGYVSKLGVEVEVRSGARMDADQSVVGNVVLPDLATPVAGILPVPQIQLRGGNQQASDPALDYTQIFPGFRPFVHATQSEVSTAVSGRNIVVTYNNSAGFHLTQTAQGLLIDRVQLSGYSVSNDAGQTWRSAFMPPAPGAEQTFGDPSIGVDRHGNFYFAQLGISGSGHGTVQVNKSTDGGNTFGPAVVVQEDDESDKEWLAVGPDPAHKNRDNVYVTWTSFQDDACELRFGRSTDGGVTWTAKTILTPTADPNPTHPQNCLQSSNITVDDVTGTVYIPYLRYSNADQDFIQMMISDDAGDTFRFATFNVAGAPDPTVFPITQTGELTACGGANLRLTIHTAAQPATPGLFGIPRYINASRILTQPTMAARNGKLYLAWSNSTSFSFGTSANSNVLFIRSNDGGQTWSAPIMVNPLVTSDTQHAMPALAIDTDPNDVHITYYTQHSNGTIDLDMANSHDGGASFPVSRTIRVTSSSFNIPPSNIPLSNAPNFNATNYDRLIAVCYALGEYQSVTTGNGTVYAAWGDARNLMTEPTNALDPISGQTHSQPDVFFQKVKAQ